MPPLPNSPFRLLVEGSDDQHSVLHLLARHGYDWDNSRVDRPYVRAAGNADLLLAELSLATKDRWYYHRLGVVIDTDASPMGRWAQLRAYAQAAGIELPELPQREGTVVAGPHPGSRIGFWLMPDNLSPGNLEVFLAKLVPENDPTWPWADEVVHEARQRGARCKPVDHPKSALHTWLAWQERPGIPFGIALQAQVFRHDAEDALRFVAWFKRLFVDA